MKKKVFVLLMAALFAGGILFAGADGLFAATEEEAEEELAHESALDMEELEKEIEEEMMLQRLEEEYDHEEDGGEEEDHNYPEEIYQDERG